MITPAASRRLCTCYATCNVATGEVTDSSQLAAEACRVSGLRAAAHHEHGRMRCADRVLPEVCERSERDGVAFPANSAVAHTGHPGAREAHAAHFPGLVRVGSVCDSAQILVRDHCDGGERDRRPICTLQRSLLLLLKVVVR